MLLSNFELSIISEITSLSIKVVTVLICIIEYEVCGSINTIVWEGAGIYTIVRSISANDSLARKMIMIIVLLLIVGGNFINSGYQSLAGTVIIYKTTECGEECKYIGYYGSVGIASNLTTIYYEGMAPNANQYWYLNQNIIRSNTSNQPQTIKILNNTEVDNQMVTWNFGIDQVVANEYAGIIGSNVTVVEVGENYMDINYVATDVTWDPYLATFLQTKFSARSDKNYEEYLSAPLPDSLLAQYLQGYSSQFSAQSLAGSYFEIVPADNKTCMGVSTNVNISIYTMPNDGTSYNFSAITESIFQRIGIDLRKTCGGKKNYNRCAYMATNMRGAQVIEIIKVNNTTPVAYIMDYGVDVLTIQNQGLCGSDYMNYGHIGTLSTNSITSISNVVMQTFWYDQTFNNICVSNRSCEPWKLQPYSAADKNITDMIVYYSQWCNFGSCASNALNITVGTARTLTIGNYILSAIAISIWIIRIVLMLVKPTTNVYTRNVVVQLVNSYVSHKDNCTGSVIQDVKFVPDVIIFEDGIRHYCIKSGLSKRRLMIDDIHAMATTRVKQFMQRYQRQIIDNPMITAGESGSKDELSVHFDKSYTLVEYSKDGNESSEIRYSNDSSENSI